MVSIELFEEEFSGEVHNIYFINKGKNTGRNVTISEKCPNCKKDSIFKVFEPKGSKVEDGWEIEIYDCVCPLCHKEFDLETEFEI